MVLFSFKAYAAPCVQLDGHIDPNYYKMYVNVLKYTYITSNAFAVSLYTFFFEFKRIKRCENVHRFCERKFSINVRTYIDAHNTKCTAKPLNLL